MSDAERWGTGEKGNGETVLTPLSEILSNAFQDFSRQVTREFARILFLRLFYVEMLCPHTTYRAGEVDQSPGVERV